MGAARNLAMSRARGSILAFTDDDCTVDPHWLNAIAATFGRQPESLGVQGKTVTDHATITPFTRQIEQLAGGPPYRTCNIAYRADVVRELGFDTELIRGEDVVMGMRVLERGPITFAPDAVVVHPPRPKEWADRGAWRVLLQSELHFRQMYPQFMPARSPTLSLQRADHVFSRWVVLPIRRYWRWHVAYLRRAPRDYLRQVPRILAEKFALCEPLPILSSPVACRIAWTIYDGIEAMMEPHASDSALRGRVALITGASRRRGIGAAIARALAAKGADIFLTYWRAYDRAMPWGEEGEPPDEFAERTPGSGGARPGAGG